MLIKSKEHYDLIAAFEKIFPHERLDKENKDIWKDGHIYENGNTNNLFLAYRMGYASGKAEYQQ